MVEKQETISESVVNEDRQIKVPWWTSCRVALAILGFFGFINVYALRVNMSVAIVCMVNQTAIRMKDKGSNSSSNVSYVPRSQCRLQGDTTSNETVKYLDGEFVWDKSTQGVILGAFFWGYLVSQMGAGWLATKVGGKRVFGYSMLAATISTFLTPFAAETHYIFLIALRVVIGLASGVCYPSMHTLWGSWAPPLERSKLAAFTYAGSQLGNVMTFPLAGLLCKYGFAGGWPSIFYILGVLSFVWFVLWMIFVSDSPSQHRRITAAEKAYILSSLKESLKSGGDKKVDVPWLKMATSLPVIALVVANVTTDWGVYTLLTSIPSYMNEVLQLDISANGVYSALPYLLFWAMINISGWIADFILTRCSFSIEFVRKGFNMTGTILPAIMLMCLGYVDCTQPGVAITLLVLGVALRGFQYSGWLVNHMDIAPAFAGILFGVSNSLAALSGIAAPYVVGVITVDQTREQWQIVFYISAGIIITGAVFFTIFAKGDIQPWARDPTMDTLESELLQGTELHIKDRTITQKGVSNYVL